jgi:homoserine kinase
VTEASFRVVAPATVANLGPGFDCLALALDLANEFVVRTGVEAPAVTVEGEGAGELPADGTNLVFRTVSYVSRELGGKPQAFALDCFNRIPLQRGLGSSASAVVAGVLIADRLLDAGLTEDRKLEMAADVEGHADNAAACLRGGLAVAYLSQEEGWRAETLQPHPDLHPVVLVPEAERISTEDARRVLPTSIPLSDVTFNLARVALALLALTARPDLLGSALEDRIHQGRRLPLAPAARALFQDLREAGIPACVAGSGPSLLAFEQDGRRVWDLGPGWRTLRPALSTSGAAVGRIV